MDFLNDEMQTNEAGESNKEFGIALKQNASYLLRYIRCKMSDMDTGIETDLICYTREMTTSTPYTLKRLNDITDERDAKRLDSKTEGSLASKGYVQTVGGMFDTLQFILIYAPRLINAFVNDWIKTSPISKYADIQYAIEESSTLTGSACCLKVNAKRID
jgi:hypothetical protein